jgi:hypothetical protein
MSNYVFGTNGDKSTLKSIYSACSMGKLTMTPATGSGIVNGVAEIVLTENISGMDSYTVDNRVATEATAKFGSLSQNFDHVMFCLPPGTSGGWLAYAYVNWYRSSFNDKWCGYPSAQVHELGHNLGQSMIHDNGEVSLNPSHASSFMAIHRAVSFRRRSLSLCRSKWAQ